MNSLVLLPSSSLVPALIAAAGERAGMRFLEFFATNIRNPRTRRTYARAAQGVTSHRPLRLSWQRSSRVGDCAVVPAALGGAGPTAPPATTGYRARYHRPTGAHATSALPAAGQWIRSACCLAARSTEPRPVVIPHDRPEVVDR